MQEHAIDQQFVALIGIDWADQKHDICLKAACWATIKTPV